MQTKTHNEKCDTAVERLRQSKARNDAKAREIGAEAGKFWAMQRADFDELRRLEKANAASSGLPLGEDGAGLSFVALIRAKGDFSQADAKRFWLDAIDEYDPQIEVVEAFADGALEWWASVQDQVCT